MTRGFHHILRAIVCGSGALALVAIGCSSAPEPFPRRHRTVTLANAGEEVPVPATQRTDLLTFTKFSVYATPPARWTQKSVVADERAEHVAWISPSGNTAFGVVFFRLPWPIGHDLTLWYGVVPEARRREGSAEVLEKHWDPDIEGLRFTLRTPRYTIETKMFVRGSRGWAAYAGTMTTRPVNQSELELARIAREDAEFGEELPATKPVESSPESADADERR